MMTSPPRRASRHMPAEFSMIRFPSMPNFRPMEGTMWYRSSKPDKLTEYEVRMLERMGIRCMVDLRTPPGKPQIIDQFYTPYLVKRTQKGAADLESVFPQDDLSVRKKKDVRETEIGYRYYVNLVSGNYARNASKRAPVFIQIWLAILGLIDLVLRTKFAAHALLYHVTRKSGLDQLYMDTVMYCGDGICHALRLMSAQENTPGVVNCAWGKDRTGVICALAQTLCGVPRDKIVEEYSRSEVELAGHRDIMVEDFTHYNLSKNFITARPETMAKMFKFIDDNFGSVAHYLEAIGFALEEQDKLRQNILCTH